MLFTLAALIAGQHPSATAHDPIPDRPFAAWLADSDYPASAIQREVSGTVGFRLDVGIDGAPTRCTVTQAADPELDRTTCDIFMARAHFQPARDRRGRAVAGSATGRVRWVLPEAGEGAPPFAAMHVANVISLDGQGHVTCSMSFNGTTPSVRAEEECGFMSHSGAAQAVRGQAIPGDLILVYTMTPEGAAAASGHEEAGADLSYEETSHLVIAPDGRVADCQRVALHIFQPPLQMHIPPACWMQQVSPFVAPAAGPATRQAETAIRIYFRRRTAP